MVAPTARNGNSATHRRIDVGPTAEWLTVAEAAQHLKVKPRTLQLWVRQRKVKAFALSGTKRRIWRFRREDLDAALVETSVLRSIPPSVRPAERTSQ